METKIDQTYDNKRSFKQLRSKTMLDLFFAQFWSPPTIKNDALAYTAHTFSHFHTFHSDVLQDITNRLKSAQKRGPKWSQSEQTCDKKVTVILVPVLSQFRLPFCTPKAPKMGPNFVKKRLWATSKPFCNMLTILLFIWVPDAAILGSILDTNLPKLMPVSRV